MPITQISHQPGIDSIHAAYRPVVFRCRAQNPNPSSDNYRPEIVFCDIYVSNIYYKSLWKSSPISDDGVAPEYEFDIQDAMQEILSYNLPPYNGRNIVGFNNSIKNVSVKFRNCFLQNGFVTSEQPEPTQGTSTSEPISGGGIESNRIYVLNSNIHHEEVQTLTFLLNEYRIGNFATGVLPLTKRPRKYKLCKNDSSYFPILSSQRPTRICLKIHKDDGEVETVCSDYLENCPRILKPSYSVIKSGDSQKFTFSWDTPDNFEITNNLTIHYRPVGNPNWSTDDGSNQPTRSLTLPIGKFDFRFELTGSCIGVLESGIINLPGFDNIGIDGTNQPPTADIQWDDTGTREDRTCGVQTGCQQRIFITPGTTDPDGNMDYTEWQRSSDGGETWYSVGIAEGSTKVFVENVIGDFQYRLKAVDTEGLFAFSNVLKFSVFRTAAQSATINNVINLPNQCSDSGRSLSFDVNGNPNQIVKFRVTCLDVVGHNFNFNIKEDDLSIFSWGSVQTGNHIDGEFQLNNVGMESYVGIFCLRPCLNESFSQASIVLTLYDNDGVTLSDQSIYFSGFQDCSI